MAGKETSKITTIKIKKDTKLRLDHLKEYKRESYEEIIEKILHILNVVRGNPEAAQGILRNIDLKLKRKHEVSKSILSENMENMVKVSQKPSLSQQEKRASNSNIRNNFMINKRIIQNKILRK